MNINKFEKIQPTSECDKQEIIVSEEELEKIEPEMQKSYCVLKKYEIVKTTQEFEEMYEKESVRDVMRYAKEENLEYAIQNNIVDKNNISQTNSNDINILNKVININNPDEQKTEFLKKLFNQYPNSIFNTLQTIIEDKNIGIEDDQENIFEMIDKLGNISPVIFDKFKSLNPKEKEEYIEKIKEIKKEMFQNKTIDMESNPDETAELIYLAYRPIGMNFSKTKELLLELEDKTEDLKDYQFPKEGYEIKIETPTEKALGKGKKLNFENIDCLRNVIQKAVEKKKEENKKYFEEISIVLDKVAKASPTLEDNKLSSLLSILKSENVVSLSEKQIDKNDINNVYNYLFEFKEVLGIVFKDNFKDDLKQLLNENPEIFERIKNVFGDEKRKNAFFNSIRKDFKGSEILTDEYWKDLNVEKTANLLSAFVEKKIIKRERKKISEELNKIEEKEKASGTRRKQKEKINLKAYVSKNIGSFFAKASAGICTADDIELFNRPDHFHFNLAEDIGNNNEIIKGNIQAYVIEDNGEKSLLLRGINPNSNFIYEIDVATLCEEIIKVAEQFKEYNGLKNVYLSEQIEGWHALSNRSAVFEYLKKYLTKENEKKIDFDITSDTEISKMYQVD
ncbi:MAG: hypothetical protein U9Q27_00560 [Patescibacteria group bacterium]|nr:hypothetical protein [Patescibacteria group bacterium]